MKPRLPFARGPNGRMVEPHEVPRGAACGCTCPACDAALLAKRGQVKVAHFSHAPGQECEHGAETALHQMAKQVLLDERRVRFPELRVEAERTVAADSRLGLPAQTFRVAEVLEARRLVRLPRMADEDATLAEGLRPDIVGWRGEIPYLIEIHVAHAVPPEKIDRLRAGGWHAFELDLSKLPRRGVTVADLRTRLCTEARKNERATGHWLAHPEEAALQARVNAMLEEKIYAERTAAFRATTRRQEARPKPYALRSVRHPGTKLDGMTRKVRNRILREGPHRICPSCKDAIGLNSAAGDRCPWCGYKLPSDPAQCRRQKS